MESREDNSASEKSQDQQALDYHASDPPGKISVESTKPTATQLDLSLAYSPGVAVPCLAIADDEDSAYRYTARGNLVAVISNGTAVLGLGNIGALASKPVMEGKGVLFKRFAGIDVFDLEVATEDVDEFVRTVKLLEPTFGAINLEDIKAPECFEIERRLKEEMGIPVFHDDQHGTAIIAGAALINALELTGREIGETKIVFSGAGAAAFGCIRLWLELGVRKENLLLVDSTGVLYEGRTERMNRYKEEFTNKTKARTLADAMVDADVFVGLSVADLLTPEMLLSMGANPIVFALANPDPEIDYDLAMSTRSDVIMGTGRSDYPNQVNNVLGFPFIFRGALDVRAKGINIEMMLAATRSLARLAKEDVPDSVLRAYGIEALRFGKEYLIPKPFDHRVLFQVPAAVAKAAMDSGMARKELEDDHRYLKKLERHVSRRLELMHDIRDRARRDPKRIVFPEGEHPKILRAAKVLVDEGIAKPILLARKERIAEQLEHLDLSFADIEVIKVIEDDRREQYANKLHERRCRKGMTLDDARQRLRSRNTFGPMMVACGDADGLLSGINQEYPDTIRPALEVLDLKQGVERVAGAYVVVLDDRLFFLADTTVNIDPSAQELADIALLTAKFARRFGVEPRVGMLSFSNFGSNKDPRALKVKEAAGILHRVAPDLEVDGEMQADTAVVESILKERYPWSRLQSPANVLIFPELQSANIAYKLIWRLARAEVVGPVLLGLSRPIHVLQRGVDVSDIVNMASLCVVDAQELAADSA